jgi:Carbohydrate esterase, sialic acid-specific acetylesterase
MKALPPILALLSILLFSCRKDQIVNEPAYDIILVAGQSNTHFGLGLDPILDAPHESIYQLGRFEKDLQIITATEPMYHHTQMDSAIGFALTFAKLYANEYLEAKHRVLIIPCGFSGSSFVNNHWNKGDFYYEDAVSRTKSVLNPSSKLVAILWHQGESDHLNSNYQENLDSMIVNMRTDLDAPNIPFILGGMVPYWVTQTTEAMANQEIIKNTPIRLPRCGYADPEFPFVIDKPDNSIEQIHYNANGMRELGKRYFSEFKALM